MRKPRKLRLLVGAVAVGAVVVGVFTPAGAHLRGADGQWFVGGRTLNDNDDPVDPINVIFEGAGREIPSALMIDDWDEANGEMSSLAGENCGTDQAIYYKHPRIRDDEQDLVYKERCFRDTYHIRLWDSKEHDDAQPAGHNDDRWAVIGVHKDDCCPDEPAVPWEYAESRMLVALAEWCSHHNNRRLPGSKGKFQAFYSNGRASRILPVAITEPGTCP